MKCEFCDKAKETTAPKPMCREHAIEFWTSCLAYNRLVIERQEVRKEQEVRAISV